ncbi:flagellar hook-basal body complex protein FliE [Roseomonas sp. HF4]|uniref:flagellar hook-basal body complex protein FliE n=1 Tax=Roseomonas sp. HF4 TaxID=2562313 RepID=UPI0010C03E51|nr:flagellar hook-basal body complex protein FliE [Roseomonas sp. HF4]
MTAALASAGAAAAYRAADALPRAGREGATEAGGFGAVLGRAMEQAVEVGREADTATTRALSGQGSVTDVVLAVGRAEMTLQTAVAVRDRVVAAYQDVMRMPI